MNGSIVYCNNHKPPASVAKFNAAIKAAAIAIKNTGALGCADTSVIVGRVYITVILLVGDKAFVPTGDAHNSPVELLRRPAAVIRLHS